MADLSVFERYDGGDVHLEGNDLVVINSLWNQPYLALFGGNVKESTSDETERTIKRNDWWGNELFFPEDPEKQFNSKTENVLNTVSLSSSGIREIQMAVQEDLRFLNKLATVTVEVSLIDNDEVQIDILMQEKKTLEEKSYQFLWNATRDEEIKEVLIVPPTVAGVPQNFVAVALSGFDIGLTWDQAVGAAGYSIQKSTTGLEGSWQLLTIKSSSASSHIDATLLEGELRFYRIRSLGIPPSEYSLIISETSLVGGVFIDILTATATSPTEIQLDWDYSIVGLPQIASTIDYDTDPNFGSPVSVAMAEGLSSTLITGLLDGTVYYFRIQGVTMTGWFKTEDEKTLGLFTMEVITTNAGSASDTMVLPFFNTTDCNVDWGDGNDEDVLVAGDLSHVYAVGGTYTIQIWGLDYSLVFNNIGDEKKVGDVSKWGDFVVDVGAFYGCSNLTTSAIDPATVIGLSNAFRSCTNLVGNDSWKDWNILQDTGMVNATGTFFSSSNFNGNISGWDLSNVGNINSFLRNCSSFTGSLPQLASPILDLELAVNSATLYDEDLSYMDFTAIVNFQGTFSLCGMSSANYNALLAKLRSDAGGDGSGINQNMAFSAGGLVATGQGVTDRQWLIDNTGMVISDATP